MTIIKDDKSRTSRSFDTAPPSYELATTTAGSASVSGAGAGPSSSDPDVDYTHASVPPRPPADAQRALAPVNVNETNSAIKGAFLVVAPRHPAVPVGAASSPSTSRGRALSVPSRGGQPQGAPQDWVGVVRSLWNGGREVDAKFSSTNGAVQVQVWWEGYDEYEGRLQVDAGTTNGQVLVGVPVVPSQIEGLSISAHSTNGKVRVYVPPSFKGVLSLRTSNGRCELSEGIQQKGLLLLSGGEKGQKRWQVGGEGGRDEVKAWSSNGRVWVGIAGEEDEEEMYVKRNGHDRSCGCVIA